MRRPYNAQRKMSLADVARLGLWYGSCCLGGEPWTGNSLCISLWTTAVGDTELLSKKQQNCHNHNHETAALRVPHWRAQATKCIPASNRARHQFPRYLIRNGHRHQSPEANDRVEAPPPQQQRTASLSPGCSPTQYEKSKARTYLFLEEPLPWRAEDDQAYPPERLL